MGVLIFLSVLGYFGNAATFVTLKCGKGLRHFTKIMLIMVTFWDIMDLIISGFYWYYNIQNNLELRKRNLIIYYIFRVFQHISRYCSIWHLSVTALEKMCFVVWPTNFNVRRASVKEALIISFSFILFFSLVSCLVLMSIKLGLNLFFLFKFFHFHSIYSYDKFFFY